MVASTSSNFPRYEADDIYVTAGEKGREGEDSSPRKDADEDIAEYGDGSVIPCTDGYSIHENIEEKKRVNGYLTVIHSETYVIGDAYTNTCENRTASFASGWRSSEVS